MCTGIHIKHEDSKDREATLGLYEILDKGERGEWDLRF